MTQAPPPTTPYGPPLSINAARRAMSAAEADAMRNNWGVSIAIVDSGGNLVMLHRLDNAQLSSVRIAEAKARTAVEFRRPTKALEDAVAGGGVGLRVLTFGASVAEGGVPIITDGKIVGGIGVSGAASQQDAQVAMAGAAAVA
jgi:glc operon protein GlcG